MRELTAQEIRRSKTAPSYANVSVEQVFGPRSEYGLALRLQKANPARYAELRLEWLYISGQERRPDSFYDAPDE
jgi:hypothetical protein